MGNILTEIISILTGGLVSYGESFGSAVSAIVKSMFTVTTGTGADAVTTLSIFGGLIAVFAGLALCFGLTRRLFSWVVSLGARK